MKQLLTLAAWCVAALSVQSISAMTTPEPYSPTSNSWVNDVLPAGAVKPIADGLHNCLSTYPENEKSKRIEGITSLAYRIGEDGSVKDVKVVTSSGNRALDKAATACVKSWRYIPAMLEGKPIEIAWHNNVKWVVDASPIIPAPPPVPPSARPMNAPPSSIGQPHVCINIYPQDAVVERAQGTTTIGFTITADGAVEGSHIVTSSGYAALDDATISCVARWRYQPAIKEGTPVAVPWRAEVRWVMH